MILNKDSNVTLVVTSCGRFDLLRRTLETFDLHNTAPIRAVIVTEDSGDANVKEYIPKHWRPYTEFVVNNPKLGQIASIDAAYSLVETDWIFHCEDDWAFYRPGFIEDSMRLLEADPQALQVWLRSFAHDLQVHSPYVFLQPRQLLDGIAFYQIGSHKPDWQGFSFNPGLRRRADYQLHAPYSKHGGEKNLSRLYATENRYALILENDAVLHTGFDGHVETEKEKADKLRRKSRDRAKLIGALALGLILGWVLNATIV